MSNIALKYVCEKCAKQNSVCVCEQMRLCSDLPSLLQSTLCCRSLAMRGSRLMAIPPWLSSSSRLYIAEAGNDNELQCTNAISLTKLLLTKKAFNAHKNKPYNTEVLSI